MRTVGRALLITFVILAIGITAYQFSTHNGFRLKSWEAPVAQLSIVEFKSGFDHPGNVWADFTIVNENAYPVQELQIHCDFRNATGAKIEEVTLHVFAMVPANSQSRYEHQVLSSSGTDMRTPSRRFEAGSVKPKKRSLAARVKFQGRTYNTILKAVRDCRAVAGCLKIIQVRRGIVL
jgi:hypothetical protein